MFTCIEFLPGSEGLFSKFYERIRPPSPEKEYVQVKGATPFLRLKVRENQIDWCKISSCLLKNERVILADNSLQIPQQLNIKRYRSDTLGMILIYKTMCRILERAGCASKINISVFDRNGILVPELHKIVKLARTVSVYTEEIKKYFYCSCRIMEESGMSIKINEYNSAAKAEGIIIADEYISAAKTADFVFLADNSVVAYNTITGQVINLPEEYRMLKSDSIDDLAFASALYELNKAKLPGEIDFVKIRFSQKNTEEEKLSELIREKVV